MRSALPTVILIWLVSLAPAWAGISAMKPFAHLSQDGKRIFVMLTPPKSAKEYPETFTLPDGRVLPLNQTLPKSGLYDAATLTPLWQVDWYALEDDLLLSPDGSDLARQNRWGLDSDWALAFYHEGRLTRKYTCGDLLTAQKSHIFFQFRTWDWHYAWYDDFELNKENHVFVSTARRRLKVSDYELDLGLQEFYTFDLSTGAMLSRFVTGRARLICLTLAFVLPLLLAGIWLYRWLRSPSEPKPKPEA